VNEATQLTGRIVFPPGIGSRSPFGWIGLVPPKFLDDGIIHLVAARGRAVGRACLVKMGHASSRSARGRGLRIRRGFRRTLAWPSVLVSEFKSLRCRRSKRRGAARRANGTGWLPNPRRRDASARRKDLLCTDTPRFFLRRQGWRRLGPIMGGRRLRRGADLAIVRIHQVSVRPGANCRPSTCHSWDTDTVGAADRNALVWLKSIVSGCLRLAEKRSGI